MRLLRYVLQDILLFFLILAAAAVMYVPAALLMLYVFNYSKRMLMVFAVIIAIFVAAVLIMFVIRIFKDIVIVLSTKKQSKFRNKKGAASVQITAPFSVKFYNHYSISLNFGNI